jgi:hypothetical protein
MKEEFDRLFQSFDDNDTALEWCENRLLAQKLGVHHGAPSERQTIIARRSQPGRHRRRSGMPRTPQIPARVSHHPVPEHRPESCIS